MKNCALQYEWVRRTREVLFRYCESIPPDDYVRPLDGFGWQSMRNLHLHVAGCYRVWLGVFALGLESRGVDPEQYSDVDSMRHLFDEVDELVSRFLSHYEDSSLQDISGEVWFQSGVYVTNPLWLFTHTTTHEFHHKGQIVTLGRQLGFAPPYDTDLVGAYE